MPAGVAIISAPYCRACGWDFVNTPDKNNDSVCDSCGDKLTNSVDPVGQVPPTVLLATAGSLSVSFTWTDNVAADSTDFRSQIDGGVFTVVIGDTSPTVIAALEGETVSGQVRSVTDGVEGPWSAADEAVALA